MTSDELGELDAFLAAKAPGKFLITLVTPPHRAGGFRLTWFGRAGGEVASLTATPATGLCCVSFAALKTCNHKRTREVLLLLMAIRSFAEDVEEKIREIRGPELTLKTTEATP